MRVREALEPSRSPSSSKPLAAYLKTPAWASTLSPTTPDGDVVLSARARLARNLTEFPFPGQASERDLRRVAQEIRRAALADTERLADLYAISIASLSTRDRAELVDARRISPTLAEGGSHRHCLLDEAGALSIFINEEDHIRIQAVVPGNDTRAALRSAEDADARLARRLTFAHHAQWGYLTTALSNVGTGLRLSALVHLPALSFLGRLAATLEACHHLDISVRGAHGEHSQAVGALYQVSNAVTFGVQPSHLAGRVKPVVDYLAAAEREARREVGDTHADRVLQIARDAWNRVEGADRLDAAESLNLLSLLRLAAAAGLIPVAGRIAAPSAALFASLVADLRTGVGLTQSATAQPASVRDAIQRPARIRTALRATYG